MAREQEAADEPGVTELAQGIVHDAETLIAQHFDLLRHEVGQELDRARAAAVSVGAGAGLLALGGVFAAHAAAHLLHRAGRLPLWASYGLVGGLLGAGGVGLLGRARSNAAGVNVGVPPQTAAALKEDVAWLRGHKAGTRTRT